MTEKDIVTTNTEGTAEEEIVDNTDVEETTEKNEDLDTDEELDFEDDSEEDATDEEKENLLKKINELEEKNKSLYQKLKSGYKKHAKGKDMSKDEVKAIMQEIYKEENETKQLVEKYEDAKDLLPEAQKVAKEKNLSVTDAYAFVKGRMFTDEGYRNQILGDRSANYGEFNKVKSNTTTIFAQGPKISKPREQ